MGRDRIRATVTVSDEVVAVQGGFSHEGYDANDSARRFGGVFCCVSALPAVVGLCADTHRSYGLYDMR